MNQMLSKVIYENIDDNNLEHKDIHLMFIKLNQKDYDFEFFKILE